MAPRFTPPEPDKVVIEDPNEPVLISKVPVAETPFEDEIEPLPDKASVPALIVVAPVYVFAPDNVSVPVPTFVSPPPKLITPEYVVELLSLPTVNTAVPVVLPDPDREPTDCANEPRAKTAPEPIVTAVLAERVLARPAVNVPPLIVVAPVYVFAPERVWVPDDNVNPPVPDITPE